MADTTTQQPQNPSLWAGLGGVLTGQTQPTVNTVIILDEKSTQRAIITVASAALLLIIIWHIGQAMSNRK